MRRSGIENILNEIASKDSQVLCREVPYLALLAHAAVPHHHHDKVAVAIFKKLI